jgi:hypothetical protein
MGIFNRFSRKNRKPYKPIVVFGIARSGTTWLAQIIASAGYELNFEALGSMNFRKKDQIPSIPIPSDYYVRAGGKNPYKKYMDLVMNCKIRNSFTQRGHINIGKSRKVIKLIRANLMIDWLQENYDFYGVFLIRNPLATINSQIEKDFFGNLQSHGPAKIYPDSVIKYFNKRQQELIRKVKTAKDRLIVNWCINTKIPLEVSSRDTLQVIRYEELVDEPKKVIKKLSEFAGFQYDFRVKRVIGKRSFTTRKETKQIKNYDPTKAWKKNFTQEEIDSAVEIVKAFNLEEYLDL